MSKSFFGFVLLSFFVFVTGCGSKKTLLKNKELPVQISGSGSSEYIEVIGMGAPSQNANSVAQKRQTSYIAAKSAALAELAEQLRGIRIKSTATVKDAATTNSRIDTLVEATIKSAEIVSREWAEGDDCIVKVRVNMKKFKENLKLAENRVELPPLATLDAN